MCLSTYSRWVFQQSLGELRFIFAVITPNETPKSPAE